MVDAGTTTHRAGMPSQPYTPKRGKHARVTFVINGRGRSALAPKPFLRRYFKIRNRPFAYPPRHNTHNRSFALKMNYEPITYSFYLWPNKAANYFRYMTRNNLTISVSLDFPRLLITDERNY